MSGVRRTALAVVALLAGAAAPQPATAAAGRPSLAGTTVVTADRSAWIAVRLPRAVDVDAHAGVVIEARGRLTAVVLKREGRWDAPFLQAVKPGYCAAPGCPPTYPRYHQGYVRAPGSDGTGRGRLPAGDYRLYVVADGAPVRVTLRLPGLPGTTSLRPRLPARAVVAAPPATVAEPPLAPALFAGGAARTVPGGGGLHVTAIWKEQPVLGTVSAVGSCEYAGAPPAGAPGRAYHAPCSGGRSDLPPYLARNGPTDSPTPTPAGPGRFVSSYTAGYLLPPGATGIGAYHDTAGPVTAAYLHQLWLDF